jgi:hypothetical protein
LPRLLACCLGVRNPADLPRLTLQEVLFWADVHHKVHGRWPCANSGAVTGAPGEPWSAINSALRLGLRGLQGGSSLPRLLAARRNVRNKMGLPRQTEAVILSWADAHYRRTGEWPKASTSGPVDGQPGETWYKIDLSLCLGLRGRPGGDTLLLLLRRRRRVYR